MTITYNNCFIYSNILTNTFTWFMTIQIEMVKHVSQQTQPSKIQAVNVLLCAFWQWILDGQKSRSILDGKQHFPDKFWMANSSFQINFGYVANSIFQTKHNIHLIFISDIQGVFFTGTPLKSWGMENLGKVNLR